jgi:hypothetical protein
MTAQAEDRRPRKDRKADTPLGELAVLTLLEETVCTAPRFEEYAATVQVGSGGMASSAIGHRVSL